MMTEVEKAAGKRAPWRVLYRRNGRAYYDAMWGDTAREARRRFEGFARELGWKVSNVEVRRNPEAQP